MTDEMGSRSSLCIKLDKFALRLKRHLGLKAFDWGISILYSGSNNDVILVVRSNSCYLRPHYAMVLFGQLYPNAFFLQIKKPIVDDICIAIFVIGSE